VIGGYFEFELLIYVAILVAGFAYDYYQRVREGEFRETVLEAQLAQSRLRALKMQLQPHFLFNTLHAVSSLMGEDVKAARRMLARLGELLRLTLDTESVEEVPLRQELEFLERYLDIERERFSDRLEVDFEIDEETLDALVPYFILQPLVENAVRHGIGTCDESGRIVVAASRSNSNLQLRVTDTGPGFPVGADSHQREGVGLSNTRARLEHMYGAQHDFEISSDPGEGCSVALSVPFREVGNGYNSNPDRR
jgi:LytS/YehU family sensor histidine kinase